MKDSPSLELCTLVFLLFRMYNLLMYEWDETKRKSNLEKHGLDFADAHLVFENPDKITLQSPRAAEERLQDFAIVELAGVLLSLVYVLRGEAIRVISFRRASQQERKLYEDFKEQSNNKD